MDSFYLLNSRDEILLEHNWKGRSLRSIVDIFIVEKAKYVAAGKDIAPIIELSRCLMFHIITGTLTIVCVTTKEIEAAYVLEMLHRIASILEDYFGFATATTDLLGNNLDTVTEILCEVIDNGSPLTTESNGLRDIVLPPSILNKLMNVTGMQVRGDSTGQLSTIPWRRAKVKYTNNEIFVDVKEHLSGIVDKSGAIIHSDITGVIRCTTKLSGTPEIVLDLKPARIIGCPLFHPSVALDRYENSPGTIVFIPPDGAFDVMTYSTELSSISSSPVPFTLQFTPGRSTNSFDVILSTRTAGLETIAIEIPLPSSCRNVRVEATKGEFVIIRDVNDTASIMIRWLVSVNSNIKTTTGKTTLSCLNLPKGLGDATYARSMATLATTAISGLKVDSLKMHRVGDWKPFKGVKYTTKLDMVFRAH